MSKFLEGVENNMPEKDIDTLTAAKREIQRMLMRKGINVKARVFADEMYLTLDDGRVVTLEIKNVRMPQASETEDAEDPAATINAITAIASMPDQGVGKMLTSTTARRLQAAKRKMATAAEKIADQFSKSVQ